MELHLESLYDDSRSDPDVSFGGSNVDSSIEIASSIDETQNELVRLSTYLQIESESENDVENDNYQWPTPPW